MTIASPGPVVSACATYPFKLNPANCTSLQKDPKLAVLSYYYMHEACIIKPGSDLPVTSSGRERTESISSMI